MQKPTAASLTTPDRRAAVLQAAAQVFIDQGYSAASIDSVIELIGGSKRTIYREFGSKEGLFEALITDLAERAHAFFFDRPSVEGDLQDILHDFATRMISLQMAPMTLGAYRLAIAEQARFPKLAKLFYDKLPKQAVAKLAAILEDAKRDGLVAVSDCQRAASLFAGMGRDNLHLEVVLGLRRPPTAKQIDIMVTAMVSLFLNGVRHG